MKEITLSVSSLVLIICQLFDVQVALSQVHPVSAPVDTVVVYSGVPIRKAPGPKSEFIRLSSAPDSLEVHEVRDVSFYKVGLLSSGEWIVIDGENAKFINEHRRGQARTDSLRKAEMLLDSLVNIFIDTRVNRVETAMDRGLPIFLQKVDFYMNSVGGIEPVIQFLNISRRRIKYTYVDLVGFNSVGDIAPGRISGRRSHRLTLVGPVEPGHEAVYDFSSEPVWYEGTTACVEVRRIKVDYMGGGSFTFVNDLRHIRHPEDAIYLSGECREELRR